MRTSVIAAARNIADVYSPVRWLWYTRRLTQVVFAGYLATTAPVDHALMEGLSALSGSQEASDRTFMSGRAVYSIDEPSLRPVAQLAALAAVLGKIHAWLRWAGKQTSFTVYDDRFPEPIADDALEAAIEQFDRRIAATPASAWLQGLEPLCAACDVGDWLLLTVAVIPGRWSPVPGWPGPLRTTTPVSVLGQFLFMPTSLTDLRHALQASGDTGHGGRPACPA